MKGIGITGAAAQRPRPDEVKMMKGILKPVRMSRIVVFSATAGVLALLLGAAGAPTARAQAGGGPNAAKV